MKKSSVLIDLTKGTLTLLLIAALLSSLCGCENRDSSHLHMANYGEQFRAENENLFPNESCEHLVLSRDASAVLSYDDARFYHISTCKYGNCDYEESYAPHVLRRNRSYESYGSGPPTYAENGYLYHTLYDSCIECRMPLQFRIYCEIQSPYCGTDEDGRPIDTKCLAGDRDWEALFHDLPYQIEIKD